MKKRIFVAAMMSTTFRSLARDWKNNHKNLSVRWIAPSNVHLTLIPPWYEEHVEKVKEKLHFQAPAIISIRFHTITFGPTHSQPRIIWATGARSQTLETVKRTIEDLLDKKPEHRPFLPHVTLARFSKKSVPNVIIEESVEWNEVISSVSLVESHLSPAGATYTPISEFSLASVIS